MKILKFCWFILLLFICKDLWATPFTVDDINPTEAAIPFLFVTNTNNITQVWAKTYSGKEILVWQHKPMLDSAQYLITFNADREGNYISFMTSTGSNQTGVQAFTTIVDLKNNLITEPMQNIYTYSATGLGVFDDPISQYALLIRPIFGSCTQPTVIPLNKAAIKDIFVPGPTFTDDTHLQIQYLAEQGVEMAEDNILIDPAKIYAQCGQAYTNS